MHPRQLQHASFPLQLFACRHILKHQQTAQQDRAKVEEVQRAALVKEVAKCQQFKNMKAVDTLLQQG